MEQAFTAMQQEESTCCKPLTSNIIHWKQGRLLFMRKKSWPSPGQVRLEEVTSWLWNGKAHRVFMRARTE